MNRSNWDSTRGASILYLDLTAVVAPGQLSTPKEIAAKDAPSRARRRVFSGDILVSTVRPNLRSFARIEKAPDDLVASTGFAVLTPSGGVCGSFVYHQVMSISFACYLDRAATGQAYPAVRPEDVIAYRLALPPLCEQRAIAVALDGVDDAIKRIQVERASLTVMKASMADTLLTGRRPTNFPTGGRCMTNEQPTSEGSRRRRGRKPYPTLGFADSLELPKAIVEAGVPRVRRLTLFQQQLQRSAWKQFEQTTDRHLREIWIDDGEL